MMELLVKFFLFHYSIMIIWDKIGFRKGVLWMSNWLGTKKGFKWLGKLFYNMSECSFCCHHWGGFAFLWVFFLVYGVRGEFFIFPIMSTGAIFLINKNLDL